MLLFSLLFVTEQREFALIVIHVKPTDAVAEIDHLADVFDYYVNTLSGIQVRYNNAAQLCRVIQTYMYRTKGYYNLRWRAFSLRSKRICTCELFTNQ